MDNPHIVTDLPVMLDTFCKAGGATRGYQMAGFYVVGVDKEPQPHYAGDEFVQADALEVLADSSFMARFAAVAASPPCQGYSVTRNIWNNRGDHPLLIEPVRRLLQASGLPWIIENVPGAPLHKPLVLCGSMFGLGYEEYQLRRHRLFEISGFTVATPWCDHRSPVIGVYGGHGRDRRRGGRGKGLPISAGWVAMGIDWMNSTELSEAIPPAYTQYIGSYLMALIGREVKVA